jgi:tripartite-type tricarboxylate transporter receptor subunit TctC
MAGEAVAAAPPDERPYTDLASAPTRVITPLMEKVRYDPQRDFQAVSLIGSQPYVLLVPSDDRGTNARELSAKAKAEREAALEAMHAGRRYLGTSTKQVPRSAGTAGTPSVRSIPSRRRWWLPQWRQRPCLRRRRPAWRDAWVKA